VNESAERPPWVVEREWKEMQLGTRKSTCPSLWGHVGRTHRVELWLGGALGKVLDGGVGFDLVL
jgi:hypothetical protein